MRLNQISLIWFDALWLMTLFKCESVSDFSHLKFFSVFSKSFSVCLATHAWHMIIEHANCRRKDTATVSITTSSPILITASLCSSIGPKEHKSCTRGTHHSFQISAPLCCSRNCHVSQHDTCKTKAKWHNHIQTGADTDVWYSNFWRP